MTQQTKTKTVADDFPQRTFYATPADAVAFLAKQAEEISDLATVPQKFVGIDVTEEGLVFDPAVYTDQTRVMIVVLKNRVAQGDTKTSAVKCLLIAPAPTLEAILASSEGTEWAQRILDKEINHVAVRNLRDADNIDSVQNIPTTLNDYISSARASGGVLDAFNELYRDVSKVMANGFRVWAKFGPKKADFKNALASRSFAVEFFPALEDREKGSLFVAALHLFIRAGEKQSLDVSIFKKWLETRDQTNIETDADEDTDLEALTASMFGDSESANEEAAA